VGVDVAPGDLRGVGLGTKPVGTVAVLSNETPAINCERRSKLLIPKQYSSNVKRVITANRLDIRFCVTFNSL
jgi:hypothetical protein